ncbi:MAG TPA: alpha/beta fold hydrolase [Candidatus Acidoferrales bacterium]|nr:alpha/beta fold hydrolase [Candidatus Acidoferrales bacterium]
MPFANSQGCRIYYRLEGSPDKPLLVLVHALGTDHGLWDPQMPALLRYFQVLRPDLRGHGASDAPAGDYTIPQLAEDVLAAAHRERFFFCGLSLGGMIGQWLAANHPARVERLVLANTSPRAADPSMFEVRRKTVLADGMAAIEAGVMQRFFSASSHAAADSIRTTLRTTDPIGYAGCCSAIRDMDLRPLLPSISVPTLVIGSDEDASTPWTDHGELLVSQVSGARSAKIPAAHLSNLARPAAFTNALLQFLLPDLPADPLEPGFAVRRAVLGDAHVDRAVASTTDFTRDFQELITRYAWGTVWTRPGIDPRIRRLLVLAMTASLGRWEEFRLHVRTGFAAELEAEDLREVLLQVAIYAGVPAANTGFHIAEEENRHA